MLCTQVLLLLISVKILPLPGKRIEFSLRNINFGGLSNSIAGRASFMVPRAPLRVFPEWPEQ